MNMSHTTDNEIEEVSRGAIVAQLKSWGFNEEAEMSWGHYIGHSIFTPAELLKDNTEKIELENFLRESPSVDTSFMTQEIGGAIVDFYSTHASIVDAIGTPLEQVAKEAGFDDAIAMEQQLISALQRISVQAVLHSLKKTSQPAMRVS